MPLPSLKNITWVTTDCYGTLIDWEKGISEACAKEAEKDGFSFDTEPFLARFFEVQAEIMSGSYELYAEVLRRTIIKVAGEIGWEVEPSRAQFLPDSVAYWLPFRESNAAMDRLGKKYDIGIISNTVYSEGLHVQPYCTLSLVLVTSAGHPLARREGVCFADTLDYDYVGLPDSTAYHHFLVQASSAAKKPLNLRVRVNNFEAVCRMAELDIGVGLVPEAAARRNAETLRIVVIPLADPWCLRQLLICTRTSESLPPFAEQLVRMLVEDGRRRSQPLTSPLP
jgi:hypothetical protein